MIIYFGIGTNLGDREANLREALRLLDERVGKQLACSSLYHSAPLGFVSENEFVNIVVAYQTEYSPEDVLIITQQIECEMGRTQKSVNGIYHDRIIDIDLLQAYQTINNQLSYTGSASNRSSICEIRAVHCQLPALTLPHPRMHERDFVMIPLRELDQLLANSVSTNS